MKILLIVYDNDSLVSYFPQGIAYIARVLKENGHEVTIYNQDVYHWSELHLKNYLNNMDFDIVGLSIIGGYYQYKKLLLLSDAINQSKNRPFYILGGHGSAPEPSYFMKKTQADAIVIGEGEITILEIVEALESRKDLSLIKGIAYNNSGKCVINLPRPLIQNIDDIDFPAYELFPIDHYALMRPVKGFANNDRHMPVLSGRGCIFKCNFCYRMDKGFRPRSADNILEEIKLLQKDYNISAIEFSDDLLMSSEKRTIELCEAIIDSGVKFRWDCNGRLNFAKPKVLKLMKKAGCVFINYGIESMDQEALDIMKKGLTVKIIHEGVRNTIDSGISPGLNIIFGNIGETKETLQKGLEFLLRYSDDSQLRTIRPVTPYPGSPLYYYAIEKGLLKDVEDFYENKHLNSDLLTVNFTDLSDAEFYSCLLDANTRLIGNFFKKRQSLCTEQAKKLYNEKNLNFRGFRQT
ncbi:MAG: radical SAM protein [Candidatus Omnitrophota bacterium]